MSGIMERTLSILELLAAHPDGLAVGVLASELDMPVSAAHRLLKELSHFDYVRQVRNHGDYALTIKMAAQGLSFLGKTGVTDVAQPTLDRLAADSGELVRLSVMDYPNLVWIAVAQGATAGLRYDPGSDQGVVVHLASSSSGRAWLATMSDDEALALATSQTKDPILAALPQTVTPATELLSILQETRQRGYAIAVNCYLAGMGAFAVAIRRPKDGVAIGCLSIAGPAGRMTSERMHDLSGTLRAAADEIGMTSEASFFFNRLRHSADTPMQSQRSA